MKKLLLLLLLATFAATEINSQTVVELTEAGTLQEKVPDYSNVTSLVVSGPINGTDLRYIREMAGIKVPGGVIAGYNIYRDGQLIGTTTDLSFVDNVEGAGDYTYQVTVVYDNGMESAPFTVTMTVSSIDQIAVNNAAFDVYSIDGKLILRNVTTLSGLGKGVYVVNNKKVAVGK